MVKHFSDGGDSSRLPPIRPTRPSEIDHASPAARAHELTIKFERVQFVGEDGLPNRPLSVLANYEIRGFVSLSPDDQDQDWESFLRKLVAEFGHGQNARPIKF